MDQLQGTHVRLIEVRHEEREIVCENIESGEQVRVRLWYDRKFASVGLRIGDELELRQNKREDWAIKRIVTRAEGEPIEFNGLFPTPVPNKVLKFLVP